MAISKVVNSTIRIIPQNWQKIIAHFGLDTDSATYTTNGELVGLHILHVTMTQDSFNSKLRLLEYIGGFKSDLNSVKTEYYRLDGIRYQVIYLAYGWAISEAYSHEDTVLEPDTDIGTDEGEV